MNARQALIIAGILAKSRPDRGNLYEPRSRLTKKWARFVYWQELCRTFAYDLCVVAKVLPESRFYERCGYDGQTWREGGTL